MMTHDEISRFFSEESVKKAFQFPDWPAGTEIVCYCRSTDSHDTIEQIAQRGGWKIVKYVHIDELPIAKLFKPGQVMFVKREALEWKRDPTMPTYKEWCNQLPVAWAYYDEIIKGIEPWMISRAESEAWAWWPDKEENYKDE